MGKLFTWNVNGIQDNNVGNEKAKFLKHKIHELRDVEICLLTETHIESKEKLTKELFDLGITHNIIHSFRKPNDTHAGLAFVMAKSFDVLDVIETEPGRIMTIKCMNKVDKTEYNFVGFYGYTSSEQIALRSNLINKLYEVLSPNTPNIISGDSNFVEEHIDRNRVGDQYFQNDRQVLPFWNKVKDDFDLINSYRAVNPTTRRYSFFTNNYKSKSRIDRIYIPSKTANKVLRANFIETSWGGHRIFSTEFSSNIQWGPGQWCLNTDLLKDLNYVNHVKDNWEEFREYRKDFENAKDWWDAAKHMVRSLTVV